MRRQRGFALLIVLWTLPLLTLIGSQIAAGGRSETRLAANLRAAARTEAVADGAAREAMFRLLGNDWAADGTPHRLRIAGMAVDIRVVDQAGRIDPNASSPELMQALLQQVGVASGEAAGLAQALLQWRTESGDSPGIAARYRAKLGYAPTFQAFRSVAEMGLVLGMTPRILAALAPHVTVFRGLDPDPRIADPVVIAALRAGGIATDPAKLPDPRSGALVAEIAVTVQAADGSAFHRRLVVQIAAVDRSNPRPWRILEWD